MMASVKLNSDTWVGWGKLASVAMNHAWYFYFFLLILPDGLPAREAVTS
jgi:hypothetical protein